MLDGGAGDDLLFLANGTQATGGEGADDFIIGDWIAGSQSATANILDFDHTEDVIVIALEDVNQDASITIANQNGGRMIAIDGAQVAFVSGTFDPEDDIDANIFLTSYTAP